MRLIRAAVTALSLTVLAGGATLAVPGIAQAQMETREGIALQNQILQLRQEIEILRRAGPGAGAMLPPPVSGGSQLGGGRPAGPGAPQGEMVGVLLDRVARLEEDLRILRGRAEEAEFRQRSLQERLEKLEGDMDFRMQQLEGQRQGSATPPARPPVAAATPPPAAPAAVATPPRRTPQRALAEGQAALDRRNWAVAESAAREVIAARDTPRLADAQILLGSALLGKSDFEGSAVAFDDAFRRNPRGSRAPEAMLGVAQAFIGMNKKTEACAQLADLRARFPAVRGPVGTQVADARRRAQCR